MDLAVLRIMMIIFESFNISPLLLSLLEKKTLQQNQREAVGVLCQMFITALLCWLMISLAGVVVQFLANLRALWVWVGLFFVFWPCRGFFFIQFTSLTVNGNTIYISLQFVFTKVSSVSSKMAVRKEHYLYEIMNVICVH